MIQDINVFLSNTERRHLNNNFELRISDITNNGLVFWEKQPSASGLGFTPVLCNCEKKQVNPYKMSRVSL